MPVNGPIKYKGGNIKGVQRAAQPSTSIRRQGNDMAYIFDSAQDVVELLSPFNKKIASVCLLGAAITFFFVRNTPRAILIVWMSPWILVFLWVSVLLGNRSLLLMFIVLAITNVWFLG